jgi:hypothetical protein
VRTSHSLTFPVSGRQEELQNWQLKMDQALSKMATVPLHRKSTTWVPLAMTSLYSNSLTTGKDSIAMLQVVPVVLSLKCGRFRRNLVATLLPAYKILLHICVASAWISHPTLNTNTPMWDTSSFPLLSSVFPDKSTSTISNPLSWQAHRSILPCQPPSHLGVQQRWPNIDPLRLTLGFRRYRHERAF